MNPKVFVIENFYDNPDDLRKYVLNNIEFNSHVYHPGVRSCNVEIEGVKDKIESFLKPFFGKIEELIMSFQVNTSFEKSWIHTDDNTRNWAGVIFLTPEAPVESGTDIYLSTETNINSNDTEVFKWKRQNHIGNIYNRCLLYTSDAADE